METESEFIDIDKGTPVVRGTGVAVLTVVNLWRSGVNMGDIPRELPDVSVAAVFAALRYYRDHEDDFTA